MVEVILQPYLAHGEVVGGKLAHLTAFSFRVSTSGTLLSIFAAQ
jgi:hypothetical protein